VSKATIYN